MRIDRPGTHLVIRNIVADAHALDLHRAEHPADVVDDLDIRRCGLDEGVVGRIDLEAVVVVVVEEERHDVTSIVTCCLAEDSCSF